MALPQSNRGSVLIDDDSQILPFPVRSASSRSPSPMGRSYNLQRNSMVSPSKPLFNYAQNGLGESPPKSAPLLSPWRAAEHNAQQPQAKDGPFNFQSVPLAKTAVTQSSVGQRRGHKYKHSSVSHQIFLEPEPRAPLTIPVSLPIPTLRECRNSMTREQNIRFWWSMTHAMIAGYILWSASGSLAITALSHLIFYDSLGAMVCMVVDVLSNFDIWKRSSIRHPFGLERVEVLAGFAMSVLLLFMGMDLVSHNLQHFLEDIGDHEAHHEHDHTRISSGEIDIAALLGIVATIVSAVLLKNHARIGRVMRFAPLSRLPFPSVLANPSHFLTITCSSTILLLPLLDLHTYHTLDSLLSSTIALAMCTLGGRLVHRLGLMLLMSYSGKGVQAVLQEIEREPSVSKVEEARFWQVHYGLCMALLKVRVRGTEEGIARLKDRVTSLVRNRLGGVHGLEHGGAMKWEVSLQITLDNT